MTEPDWTLLAANSERLLGEMREMRAEIRADMRGMREDQHVMIRMLQQREAELETMRSIDERYRSLRLEVDQLRRRLEKIGA
jgi:hypothetical protein